MRTSRQERFQHPNRPSLQFPALTPLDLHDLHSQGSFDGAAFSDVDASGIDLSGTIFTECDILSLTADNTRLTGARFVDTRLSQMQASHLKAARTSWRSTHVASSRVGVLEAFDSELSQVLIEGSKLGWVNLRASKLTDVDFVGCRFDELDLSGCTLNRVAFEDCSADTLVLQQTTSRHLDLRGIEFSSLQGGDGLAGARMTEPQSLGLLGFFTQHFGIEVV